MERNQLDVKIVQKDSIQNQISQYTTKEIILKIDHLDVNIVKRDSKQNSNYKSMKEFIQVKDHMNAKSVRMHLVIIVT